MPIKAIVSGAEKDIKRIPMKGQNLFDKSATQDGYYIDDADGKEKRSAGYVGVLSASDYIDIENASNIFITETSRSRWGAYYDSSKIYISGFNGYGAKSVPSTARYVRITVPNAELDSIMLNLGSTPLPYEPYGYQEGWEVRDNQNRLIWGREETLTETGSISFKGAGIPLKSVDIFGNTQQTGKPSPDNIIVPDFCGVRTMNLAESVITSTANYLYIYTIKSDIISSLITSRTFTLSFNTNVVLQGNSIYLTTNNPYYSHLVSTIVGSGNVSSTFTLSDADVDAIKNSKSCRFHVYKPSIDFSATKNVMLNLGSTALPYEPYGYKIPITCAGQTVPVNLGEAPTVRRIRKLVLTGEETFVNASTQTVSRLRTNFTQKAMANNTALLFCSHYFANAGSRDGAVTLSSDGGTIYFGDNVHATDADTFKQYLREQYAAGTPVTVWYVLAEPETGIVNEPLAKIGDYADELSSTIPIPTVKGANVLTVDTTLPPSSMSITGHITSAS
jgi:hypothetical protein